MDHIVRTALWVTLFGGTSAVVAVVLPKIVVWCLEIVASVQVTRSRRNALHSRPKRVLERSAHDPTRT